MKTVYAKIGDESNNLVPTIEFANSIIESAKPKLPIPGQHNFKPTETGSWSKLAERMLEIDPTSVTHHITDVYHTNDVMYLEFEITPYGKSIGLEDSSITFDSRMLLKYEDSGTEGDLSLDVNLITFDSIEPTVVSLNPECVNANP